MTKNREDYIKSIFEFEERGEKISNKKLAKALNVSPASSSEMVSKLIKAGILNQADTYFYLSEKGNEIAKELISKHRLWESFLLNYLDYSWDNVHEEAEVLEHVTSPLLKDKLNEFLKYPKTCPHGGIIYENQSLDNEENLVSLRNLNLGDIGIIKRVKDNKELLSYLNSIGVNINDKIKLIEIADYEGPFTIEKKNTKKQISYKATSDIFLLREEVYE